MKQQALTQSRYSISQKEITDTYVGEGILTKVEKILTPHMYTCAVVLCDTYTKHLLPRLGRSMLPFVIPQGEQSKRIETVLALIDFMYEKGLDRKSALLALGGGVVGDVATVAAGLFYRGIDCIQIPTTLLAQVDSALGGKGAVNVGKHKNTIGIIRQPRAVIIDTSLPLSLPKEQVRSGIGEIVKYALAMDRKLFAKLEKVASIDEKNLTEIIERCVKLKMEIVEKDPLDNRGIRQIVNFGHTLGHAIELEANLLHGEAISAGMTFAIALSVKRRLLSQNSANRTLSLLRKYNLPTTIKGVSATKIEAKLAKDKKSVAMSPRFVLLKEIGQGITNQEVSQSTIQDALEKVLL